MDRAGLDQVAGDEEGLARREVFLRAFMFAFLGALLVVFWSAVTLAVLAVSRGWL